MAEKTTKKNTKGNKKAVEKKTTGKVATKKTTPKKEEKVVVSKVEKKEGKVKAFFNKIIENRPFAISLCVIIILAVALGITLLSKRIPKTSDGKQIVAQIEGKKITADDLYLALKDEYGYDVLLNMIDGYITKKEGKLTEADEKEIQDIVDEWKAQAQNYGVTLPQLVASYGLNIDSDEEFYDFLAESYSKAYAVMNFIGDEASEEELKNFYEENYSDKITVRHILISIDQDADDLEYSTSLAYDRAKELIGELEGLSGNELENKFSELATDNSDDTGSYGNGGLVEDITKNAVVTEFYDASAKLKDGEYTTEPVKTQYGYHIIYRVSSTPLEKYENIKDAVKRDYGEQVLNSDPNLQITKWNELREKYKLDIVDSDLKDKYEKSNK